jgi:LysM repeat protein
MDNNDSNLKSQQTGGLKLMTVFIAVLALHVVVIGGFTVYHLMSGGTTDADLTTTDKTHKDSKGADGTAITDGTTPDASQGEKSASTSTTATAPTEVATIPATSPAPEPEAAAPAVATTATPAPTPAPAPSVVPAPAPTPVLTPAPALTLTAPASTPVPAPLAPPAEIADQGSQTPTGPISSTLAPPPDSVPAVSAPVISGPVHMPSVVSSPAAPKSEREHEQIYTVKITDSYKKIAHAHHVTVAQLKEANHIKGDVLHTGQKLVIPSEKRLVAENASTSTSTLASAPSTPVLSESVSPMTTSLASTSSSVATIGLHHHLYTVVKGDTLTKIAHKFKTTSSAIMAENGITDPTKLSIGKKLKIPSEESRSARNTPPASTQPSQVQAKENAPSAQLATFVP